MVLLDNIYKLCIFLSFIVAYIILLKNSLLGNSTYLSLLGRVVYMFVGAIDFKILYICIFYFCCVYYHTYILSIEDQVCFVIWTGVVIVDLSM